MVLESWRWSLRPSFYTRQGGRVSLRPSSTPGRVGVVLGAQFYTRQVGRIWSKMITAARGDEHRQRLLGAAIQRQRLLEASFPRAQTPTAGVTGIMTGISTGIFCADFPRLVLFLLLAYSETDTLLR